jgi:hypothetical protein
MKANELAALLDSHIDNQSLSLNGSLFPDTGISDLLNTLFSQDHLIIEAPKVSIQADKVLLTGRSGFSTHTTYPIQMSLWDDQGSIEACICLKPDATQLKTILAQLTSKPDLNFLSDSDLKILDLVLCTQPVPNDESSCPLIQGLNLIGNYVLPVSLSNLSDVFADVQSLQIHGTLIQKGDTYRFQWLSPAFTSLTIGSFQADLSLKLIHAGHGPKTVYQLVIDLPVFGESLALASEPFSDNMGFLLFNADLFGKGINLQSTEQLCQLLQSADLSFLPEKFKPAENLTLSRFQCILSMHNGMIKSLNLGLTFSRRFEVIPNTLAIKSESLNFIVSDIPANPHVSTSLAAAVQIGDIELDAHMLFPSTRLQVNLQPEHPIPIARLVKGLIPAANLPALHIEKIRGEVEAEAGQYMLECWIASDSKPEFLQYFPKIRSQSTLYLSGDSESASAMIGIDLEVGDTEVNLGARLQEHAEVFGNISYLSLKDIMKHLIGQELLEIPDIGIRDGYMRLQSGGKFFFSGSLSFDFLKLSKAWNIPIPDTLANFTLNSVSLNSDMLNKKFVLQLIAYPRVPLLQNSDQKIEIVGATFQISESSQIAASLTFHGEAEIAEQVKLICENLTVNYDSPAGKWTAESQATLLIYGQSHELSVSLSNDHIGLTCPGEIVLSRLGGSGKVAAQQLSVFAEKNEDGNDKGVRWGLAGDIELVQSHSSGEAWLDVQGHLSLETGAGGRRLKISAEAPKLPDVALDLGGAFPHAPQLRLSLDDFGFEYTQSERKDVVWVLRASARMQILQIPSLLKKYLPPEELKGYFRTDGETTSLGFDVPSTFQPEFPELALEFSNNKKLSLGQPQLTITKIALTLDKTPQLIEEITVGLPKELNHLFGMDSKGKPNRDLFSESFRLKLALGQQLGIKLCSSPFKDMVFYEKDGKMWSDGHFGDLGEYSFQVPEFSFNNGRWKASAGFERQTDIKLPLKPIKFLLTETGIPQAALAPIPDAIPIKGVDLRNNGFHDWVTDILGDEVLGRIDPNTNKILKEFTDVIQGAIERLPNRMQEYFDLRIPDSAMLDIAVDSGGGGMMIGFRILDNDPPLKILFPFLGAVPEIVGITVRGFSFGQRSGGTLAMVEFDGHIDRFDLLPLTAALALDQGKNLTNRYILKKTLVVMPTGIPLAIPLFFDELGLEYKDVLGREIQSRWQYPQPEMGLLEYLQLFTALFQFFTKDDYLLHKAGLSDVIPLQLTIGINKIRLPDFLGGGTIGLSRALPPVNVTDSVTRLLDSLKTGNAGYAIEAIPLKNEDRWIRIGGVDVHFGPLELTAHWCITTEQEFGMVVLPEVKGDPELSTLMENAVLKSLPRDKSSPDYDKGFIVLLTGSVAIGQIAGFQAQFGIAATASGGFETGFRLIGTIADRITLAMGGRIHANESNLEIEGNVNLTAFEQILIDTTAMIAVSEARFEADVRLLITRRFALAGALVIGPSGLSLSGTIEWVYGIGPITLVTEGGVHFSENGMVISGTGSIYGINCSIDIRVPADTETKLFKATISLDFPDFVELFAGDLQAGAAKAKREIEDASNQVTRALKAVSEVDLNVNSLKAMIVHICDTATNATNTRINAIPSSKTYSKKIYKKVLGKRIHLKTISKTVYPRKAAKAKAAVPLLDLANLKKAAQSDNKQTLVAIIEKALNKVIQNNLIKVVIKINLTVTSYNKTFYDRDMLTKTQISQLTNLKNNLRDWIGKLPEREGRVRLSRDHVATLQNSVAGRLTAIANAIDEEISDAIPRVEAIMFESELQLVKKTEQEISVVIRQGEQKTLHTVGLDFNNPAKASKALFQSFANSL